MHGYLTSRTSSGNGGKSRGSSLSIRWGNKWAPPKVTPTEVRLLPGAYMSKDGEEGHYYQYISFYSARTNKSFITSAEWTLVNGRPERTGGECLGWDEFDRETAEGVEQSHRTVSRRLMHAFNGIHLDWYHDVPVERDGKVLVYENGPHKGEQITNKQQCTGRKCDYCAAKLPKSFGKKIHWSMGLGHLNNLVGAIDEIEKDCANCGGIGTIEKITCDCEECGQPVISVSDFDLSNEKQAAEYYRITGSPYKCRCGHVGWLLTQLECSNTAAKCKDPKPRSLFDCDIEVKRQGEGASSTVQVVRWTPTVLSEDLMEMAKPYNFSEIFSPDPMNIQAEILGIRNPQKDDRPQAREYGKANFNK